MITIALEPQEEEEWLGENPSPATFPPDKGVWPLRHQWLTAQASSPIIVNAYNTGTGKTKAACLRILQRAQERQMRLDPAEDNVLFIAPTNELLAQHVRDLRQFCADNGLPYRVLPMTGAQLDAIWQRPDFSEKVMRRGAVLSAVLEDPRRVEHDRGNRATILVINPDIFYYAFYFRYGRFDRLSLFEHFFTMFNLIIVDEFHYYTPKQLANFLFFMHLSRHFGQTSGSTQRQFCLLTATPEPRVERYLQGLGMPIDVIDPRTVAPAAPGTCRPVRALAPVTLEVYSTEELQRDDATAGLIALVAQQRQQILRWLTEGQDGAIISSSLWRIHHIFEDLRTHIAPDQLGRITGPQSPDARHEASRKQLILATPTVDIGYNFEKGGRKARQNIDFEMFDARSGDEFIQRLGRAGRVLGKEQRDIPSRVIAVVTPEFYQALQPYADQTLSRAMLRELAVTTLPPRNDLYAYVREGGLAEAFLPLYRLKQMLPTEREHEVKDLYESLRVLFEGRETLTYEKLKGRIYAFLKREECYAPFEHDALAKRTILRNFLAGHPSSEKWLAPIKARLKHERERRLEKGEMWDDRDALCDWVDEDIRAYFIEKARFSFREYFQPPQALIADPQHLHSDEDVCLDDAMRIARFFNADYYETLAEWEQKSAQKAPMDSKDALLFCQVRALRPPNAQRYLGLRIDARGHDRVDWEATFANRITALTGLTVVPLNDSHGLHGDIIDMLSERYIPALVARDVSPLAAELWQIQRRAMVIPYRLQITFRDGGSYDYWAVLGTMALQVWDEMPARAIVISRHRALADEDASLIY